MFATLHEGWAIFEPYLKAYGSIAIFVMVYLESLGSPLPGETGVIAASLLAAKGELNILTLYPAVLLAAILGDSTGYWIGRLGGRAVLRKFGPYIGLTPDVMANIEQRFRKGGLWIVLFARFVPVLRQLNGLVAGSLGLPFHLFLMAQSAGALLWTSVYCLGPYFFSELFQHLK
jgi:membrane protein DedA with SNARE-associated domain